MFYSVILMAQPNSPLVRDVEAARRSVAFGVAFASALRCAILLPVPSRTLQVVLVWSLLRRLLPPPLVQLLLFFWQFKEKIKRNCR